MTFVVSYRTLEVIVLVGELGAIKINIHMEDLNCYFYIEILSFGGRLIVEMHIWDLQQIGSN